MNLSARVLQRDCNHEKMWRSRNVYHETLQSWDFQRFHENFELYGNHDYLLSYGLSFGCGFINLVYDHNYTY